MKLAWVAVGALGVTSVTALFVVEPDSRPVEASPGPTVAAPGAEATSTTAAPATSPTTAAPGPGGETARSDTRGSATTTPTAKPPDDPFDPRKNTMPLTGGVQHACVTPGSTQTATLKTRSTAAVAAAAGYSDGQAHGALYVGNADADGSWSWTFVVSPEAPTGDAAVIVSVQDRTPGSNETGAGTNGESARARWPFVVREKC